MERQVSSLSSSRRGEATHQCELCSIACNNYANLKRHISGQKHKTTVHKLSTKLYQHGFPDVCEGTVFQLSKILIEAVREWVIQEGDLLILHMDRTWVHCTVTSIGRESVQVRAFDGRSLDATGPIYYRIADPSARQNSDSADMGTDEQLKSGYDQSPLERTTPFRRSSRTRKKARYVFLSDSESEARV